MGREEPLFKNVSFGLDEGCKAALIGRNGTGKSTLLNTIAGNILPDEGTVVCNNDCGISFLPQNPAYNSDDTIKDHIFKSSSPKLETIRRYEDACLHMDESVQTQQIYEKLCDQMEKQDLWNYETQIRSILNTFGITDMNRTMGMLSGGMIKKVALAQVLVEDTKLLLLDEPTNHLDITTISLLQEYLHDTKRSIFMVTHDRYFLDAVCTNIYELERGTLNLYHGNYSTYLEKKETEQKIAQNTDRRIETVIRIERDWLMRGPCARGTKAKARIQRDMQLINREKFRDDKGFSFEVKGRRLGGKVLELHHITKNYPKGSAASDQGNKIPVLKDFSYTFTKGQKIGVFGDNGTGKSTLLNIIAGKLKPDSGRIETGENTVFAYYEQNPVFQNTNLTVLDYIKETAEVITMNNGKILKSGQFLEEFGFSGKIQYSPVSTLSGGERKRLYLVRLLLTNPNFLMLDEPTNDFDIFTMNILEEFLDGYDGCLLIVSHDRYFMDKTADTLFILEDDGSVSGFVGKCSEYIQYRKEKREEEDAEQKKKKEVNTKPPVEEKAKPRKRSFKEQKELEQIEIDIAELEAEQKNLEQFMNSGVTDFAAINNASLKYQKVTSELEKKYSRWEELAEISS
jgi:ATP-binding cassette subfamily F protein uup